MPERENCDKAIIYDVQGFCVLLTCVVLRTGFLFMDIAAAETVGIETQQQYSGFSERLGNRVLTFTGRYF